MQRLPPPWVRAAFLLLLLAPVAAAQEIPASGSFGIDLFATTRNGQSTLWFSSRVGAAVKLADLPAPPSRWLHRRRHMAAEEAPILRDGVVLFLPLGDNPKNGALEVVDLRRGLRATSVPLSAPPSYDPVLVPGRSWAVCAADSGKGETVLEVVTYATPGGLARILGKLAVRGAPAGGVTRLGLSGSDLLVPTTAGVHILTVGTQATPLRPKAFVPTAPRSPVTNLALFTRGTAPHAALLVSNFGTNHRPSDAAVVSFDLGGKAVTTPVGNVANTNPPKPYVPAAGCHDPGVVARGGIAFVAFLLREREPGTFFTKPAGVAVAGFGMANDPTFTVVRTSAAAGEPFAELSVHETRMAFLSSESPRWWPDPPGGSERINILYTPLDPVGAATTGGVIGTAGPLGGRIGVELTDRPLWSRDGRTIFVTTVNFPGAPNPGRSGSELLPVPDARPLNPVQDRMHTVLELRDQTKERAYGLPARFAPWSIPARAFGDFTLFGQMTQTAAHGVLVPHRVRGYLAAATATPRRLPRDGNIPPFPAIPPRTFDDVNGSVVKPPATFGARRASFNLFQRTNSILAAYLVQADGDELLYQLTGVNTLSFGVRIPMLRVKLPAGSKTATELLSL